MSELSSRSHTWIDDNGDKKVPWRSTVCTKRNKYFLLGLLKQTFLTQINKMEVLTWVNETDMLTRVNETGSKGTFHLPTMSVVTAKLSKELVTHDQYTSSVPP